MSDLPTSLFIWWMALCAVSLFNIGVLVYFWVKHLRKTSAQNLNSYQLQRRLLWLSTFFVLGCAFRSFLPRADVQRIALVDSWLSSILVGRTVATIAELCFVAQWAILLGTFARAVRLDLIVTFSKLVIPAILVAEVFSWLGVLTTNNFWHFLEESIWGVTEVFLTVSAFVMWRLHQGRARRFMGLMAVCGAIYVTFMFTSDIPTYYSRWRLDLLSGKIYTGLAAGLGNITYHWTATHQPQDWQGEFIWMIIYFSLAVWISLAFTQAPLDQLEESLPSTAEFAASSL